MPLFNERLNRHVGEFVTIPDISSKLKKAKFRPGQTYAEFIVISGQAKTFTENPDMNQTLIEYDIIGNGTILVSGVNRAQGSRWEHIIKRGQSSVVVTHTLYHGNEHKTSNVTQFAGNNVYESVVRWIQEQNTTDDYPGLSHFR